MSTAPTLPTFNTGALTPTQLSSLVTGITFATGLAQKLANIGVFNSIGGCTLAASTSATYVDVTGASFSWTKLGDGSASNILAILLLSCWTSVAATQPTFGVGIGGTGYDLARMTVNPVSSHISIGGGRSLTGVAARAHNPQLRFKRAAGTGGVNIDTGDTVSMILIEVPL